MLGTWSHRIVVIFFSSSVDVGGEEGDGGAAILGEVEPPPPEKRPPEPKLNEKSTNRESISSLKKQTKNFFLQKYTFTGVFFCQLAVSHKVLAIITSFRGSGPDEQIRPTQPLLGHAEQLGTGLTGSSLGQGRAWKIIT